MFQGIRNDPDSSPACRLPRPWQWNLCLAGQRWEAIMVPPTPNGM